MKYFFKPYSIFLYVAMLAVAGMICLDGEEFDIRINNEYYTLINRGGLLLFAFLFGFIWLIYIFQEAHLQSRKLRWIHFAASFITLAAVSWYHAQGFIGKNVHVEGTRLYRGRLEPLSNDFYVLPYSGILLLLFVAAQITFIVQLVKGNMHKD